MFNSNTHTIYYNKAKRDRSPACHLSSFRIAPKKAQCASNPGNLGTESIPTNNPSIFNNQISLCVTLFRIWRSRESIHFHKKYPRSRSYVSRLDMFIPLECTCSEMVYLSVYRLCARLDSSTCRRELISLVHRTLSPLHWFLLDIIFYDASSDMHWKNVTCLDRYDSKMLCVGGTKPNLCFLYWNADVDTLIWIFLLNKFRWG